jgi:hypothetical protein
MKYRLVSMYFNTVFKTVMMFAALGILQMIQVMTMMMIIIIIMILLLLLTEIAGIAQ